MLSKHKGSGRARTRGAAAAGARQRSMREAGWSGVVSRYTRTACVGGVGPHPNPFLSLIYLSVSKSPSPTMDHRAPHEAHAQHTHSILIAVCTDCTVPDNEDHR